MPGSYLIPGAEINGSTSALLFSKLVLCNKLIKIGGKILMNPLGYFWKSYGGGEWRKEAEIKFSLRSHIKRKLFLYVF